MNARETIKPNQDSSNFFWFSINGFLDSHELSTSISCSFMQADAGTSSTPEGSNKVHRHSLLSKPQSRILSTSRTSFQQVWAFLPHLATDGVPLMIVQEEARKKDLEPLLKGIQRSSEKHPESSSKHHASPL
ncbi:hypothetical protein VNO77_27713 [Canavalia gladiata]|uniref:Uncharacterized protein n=1 Tax=Canavalia gladiata TaxID=3824 RepID=A0AAN9KXE5_CANGL